MRTEIVTTGYRFRVSSAAKPRQRSRENPEQRRTPDGRPIWIVGLSAFDAEANKSETIWVEVAGDEPKLTVDDLVSVHRLVFAPWVNREHKIVRSFRADLITSEQARKAA